MATFEKDILEDMVKKCGSWEKFAQTDGCFRIYESDSNYHTCRKQSDVQSILSSPYIKNPREVWPNRGTTIPTAAKPTAEPTKTSSGCFIATAAYGSPFSSEVVHLRHFRDTFLLPYKYGRSFVAHYERVSPRPAAFIAVRPWLRSIVRHSIVEPLLLVIKIIMRKKEKISSE